MAFFNKNLYCYLFLITFLSISVPTFAENKNQTINNIYNQHSYLKNNIKVMIEVYDKFNTYEKILFYDYI